MDDLEQNLKEKLLQGLIEHMSDKMSDRLKPKGMAVEVSAPDKGKLAEGLDKAKSVLGSVPDSEESDHEESDGDESDESRLMQLMGEDDDEDEKSLRR